MTQKQKKIFVCHHAKYVLPSFLPLTMIQFQINLYKRVEILGHATVTYYKTRYMFDIDSNVKYFLVWKTLTNPKYLRHVPVLDTLELAAGIFCLFLSLLSKLQWVKNFSEEAFQFHAPIFSLFFSSIAVIPSDAVRWKKLLCQ